MTLAEEGFILEGLARTVTVVVSDHSRWYRPRLHVILYNEAGHLDEVWRDATFIETVFIVGYHMRFGWKYTR